MSADRPRPRGVTVGVTLTRDQAAAYLAADPPSRGHGVRRSLDLTEADARIREALAAALADTAAPVPAPPRAPRVDAELCTHPTCSTRTDRHYVGDHK